MAKKVTMQDVANKVGVSKVMSVNVDIKYNCNVMVTLQLYAIMFKLLNICKSVS